MNMFITVITCISAVTSLIISIIAIKRNNSWAAKAHLSSETSNKLQEELVRIQAGERFLNWHDIEKYISVILQKMKEDNFVPDCIVTPAKRDSIVAFLLSQAFHETVPIYLCMLVHKENSEDLNFEGFDVHLLSQDRVSARVYMYVQQSLPVKSSDKILIVRDHTASGISSKILSDNFISKYKVKPENIKVACIACSEGTRHMPNYFCFHSNKIWFPWGKNI